MNKKMLKQDLNLKYFASKYKIKSDSQIMKTLNSIFLNLKVKIYLFSSIKIQKSKADPAFVARGAYPSPSVLSKLLRIILSSKK